MTRAAAAVAQATIAQQVTSEIRGTLDRIDAMPTGSGHLDLGGYVRGYGDTGVLGAQLEYDHRVSRRTSVFGNGSVGYGWGALEGLNYSATAGLRMRW